MRQLLPVLLLLLAGCVDMPRDPEGTLSRVRETRLLRIGVAAAAPASERLLARVAASTGARVIATRGEVEPLLAALEAGSLDLVQARLVEGSPWATRVTVGEPLDTVMTPAGPHHAHLIARNGENAWVMLIERETRALGHGR